MAARSTSASSSTYQQYRSPFGDTTLTKVFVGGLAWETPTEKMREYFEQFGEILEAVIISDKNTGKSKGYGFVTFGDPQSAKRAIANVNPMIDGRRANCNIASAGRPPPRGRVQGQSGQIYNPGGAQGGSSYNPVQGPLVTPPVPSSVPPMHPAYGYTDYNPAYGYNQVAAAAMYNQQLQQAQYYQQLYGSSTSPNLLPLHHPYYYAYSMHAPRAAAAGGGISSYPTMPPRLAQRSQGPYIYYSSPSPLNLSPTSLFNPQLQQQQPSASSDSSRHQQLPSRFDLHESSQLISPEPDAKAVTYESPSND